MRIIALVNAFNEENLVMRCVGNIHPYVDTIVLSDTDWPTGTRLPDDHIHIITQGLKDWSKVIYCPPEPTNNPNPRIGEAIIKTRMMNAAKPENGDWIWIVEADEFYLAHQLQGLRDRLLLGHKAIHKYDKRWIHVSALTFAYNLQWCYYEYHGRFFKYKKGSKFTVSNHFHWPNEEISVDKYRWHIPISHLCQFHLKFVKPLDRLAKRSILNTNPKDDEGYGKWFHDTFRLWPSDPEKALQNNPPLHGWAKGTGQKLFQYIGEIPKDIKNYKLNLYKELKNG